MGRVADGALAATWRRRVARQRRSGLAVEEFCRREGFSSASFYAWRKRVASSRASSGPLFVPVELPAGAALVGGVRIELPGGAVVTLPQTASAELLTTAIRAAMSAASMSNAEDASC